jgi:hypothetical protein
MRHSIETILGLLLIELISYAPDVSAKGTVTLPTLEAPLVCGAADDWGSPHLITIKSVEGGFKLGSLFASDVTMSITKKNNSFVLMAGNHYSSKDNAHFADLELKADGSGVLTITSITKIEGDPHGHSNSFNYFMRDCRLE